MTMTNDNEKKLKGKNFRIYYIDNIQDFLISFRNYSPKEYL